MAERVCTLVICHSNDHGRIFLCFAKRCYRVRRNVIARNANQRTYIIGRSRAVRIIWRRPQRAGMLKPNVD
jgi:hypothetical protein